MNIRRTNSKAKEKIFTCSKYNKLGVAHCSQHKIKYDNLYNIILNEIQDYSKKALVDEKGIAKELEKTCSINRKNNKLSTQKSIEEDSLKIENLGKIITKLYDDYVNDKINEVNFNQILEKTQKEQQELLERVETNQQSLNETNKSIEDNAKWLDIIKDCVNVTELDANTLNKLIKKIVMHENIEEDVIKQTIEIYFNFTNYYMSSELE